MFSPHAWGWTGRRQGHADCANVFPTRVGVDRRFGQKNVPGLRFPHTRGGGPYQACGRASSSFVFPTRVGVDRQPVAVERLCPGFPHTRGGGPSGFLPDSVKTAFSPHAWGWTGCPNSSRPSSDVFPHTRGGGPLSAIAARQNWVFSPHAWGWTDPRGLRYFEPETFSPHAWGWTAHRWRYGRGARVFPTRVGVDPSPRPCTVRRRSFPHTRGGGPHRPRLQTSLQSFSPHAWGWTDVQTAITGKHRVFPTRVGVDRKRRRRSRPCACFPHTRGGGPHPSIVLCCQYRFSPHAWGWTDVFTQLASIEGVFPHTRGGGPSRDAEEFSWAAFSPHAWGWTVAYQVGVIGTRVFPTRVGVDRLSRSREATRRRFPHTRGGGPRDDRGRFVKGSVFPTRVGVDRPPAAFSNAAMRFPHTRGGGPVGMAPVQRDGVFSPHAWGWTGALRAVVGDHDVFPTRVGVDRRALGRHTNQSCFPHTRGGGPLVVAGIGHRRGFSPHAWGWTDNAVHYQLSRKVFPTRVGVDRTIIVVMAGIVSFSPTRVGVDRPPEPVARSQQRFPHTRGGGPRWPLRGSWRNQFSPHAWGWTATALPSRCPSQVFPTRVGVDRCPLPLARAWTSFPHTRGGGPWRGRILARADVFSPHAWGWTGALCCSTARP